MKKRRDETPWLSKRYDVRFQTKRFYVAKIFLKVKDTAKRKGYRNLWLWLKDLQTPGQPVYYAKLCLADFTMYLKRRIKHQLEWTSKVYFVMHRGNPVGRVQFFLNFDTDKNGKVKPRLILKYTEKLPEVKAEYFSRLSVSDFSGLDKYVKSSGKPPTCRR